MTCKPVVRGDAGRAPVFQLTNHNVADLVRGHIHHDHHIIQQTLFVLFLWGRGHFDVQGVAGTKGLAGFNIQVPAQFTRQLIAQPEGEGIGFAVVVALSIVKEREVKVIDFAQRHAFARIQDTDRQAVLSGFVCADFQRDLADLSGGDGVLNQHQHDAAQGIAVAVAFIVGRQMVVNQQLQPFTLNHRQDFRHHFVDQILNREQGRVPSPGVVFQHISQLNFIHHPHERIRLSGKLMAFWRADVCGLACQRFQRMLKRIADVLHKDRAALLVLLIQSLGLLEFLVHQHFTVLIADDKDLGAGSNLAAELTNFIQFIINGGLNDALVLIGHRRDVLQIQVRQQMIGNLVAHNGAIGFLIMHQQPEREDGDNLLIQRPQDAQFVA